MAFISFLHANVGQGTSVVPSDTIAESKRGAKPADMTMIARADTVTGDSVTLKEAIENTWETFKETKRIEFKDTLIRYPKFIRFCLNVYNWVERNFNTYDTEYVTGTGKHGKVRLVSDNWSDIHSFRFNRGFPLIMASDPYSNLGIQANYSILSIGFSVDMNAAISGKKSQHHKTNFGITMARLYLEAYYWRNTGQTKIRTFGDKETGIIENLEFDGLNSKSLGIGGFYYFNYKKYSHAAAYNLSTYQKKNAGSWIAGITGQLYDCTLDFDQLPEEVKEETNFPFSSYHFDYNAVNLIGGYGFNWVLGKHWLFNVTALPGLGLSFSFSDATNGRHTNLSLAGRILNSLTYCTRQFFVTATSFFHSNFYLHKRISFMSATENFQVSTGVRF
ncbi:MAG: DUF4421 domain-containing protein [Muribaculaceae bacterium]|nr:DUF4421 domain-containing protein [Muribaculaceae bacterium]